MLRSFLVSGTRRGGALVIAVSLAVMLPGGLGAQAGAESAAGREQAYLDALRAGLLELLEAERRWHDSTGAYTFDLSALRIAPGSGVRLAVTEAGPSGFGAVAVHRALPEASCVVYLGEPSNVPETMRGRVPSIAGEPACDAPDPLERHQMAMRAALRRLASIQNGYWTEHRRYAATLLELDVYVEEGVSLTLPEANEHGWSARATHYELPGMSCVMFVGRVMEVPATERGTRAQPGRVVCDRG